MGKKSILFLVMGMLVFSLAVFAQVATKTGSIFGKVADNAGAPLPGVTVTLESDVTTAQTATTGATGAFRFTNLPPGKYSVNCQIEGYTELRQEDIAVNVGSEVQLSIKLNPMKEEQLTVIAETPVVDSKKTGETSNYNRDYLDKVPTARDPWVILEQTPGVDVDRFNVGGSESGQQSSMASRGASLANTGWNYDGVNLNDSVAAGGTTYMDFDAFAEVQIVNAGSDASIGTNGIQVNVVTKRGGNKWAGNGNFLITSSGMVGTNTPQEALDLGLLKSTTVDMFRDYGFDFGGPIIKDRLFAWGAYRKNDIHLIRIGAAHDNIELKDLNFKGNFSWNSANESQFTYMNNDKVRTSRSIFPAADSAPEAFVSQGNTVTILPGLWTGQHTWMPNDQLIVTGRYAYWGLGFTLLPIGGVDSGGRGTTPVIYLQNIPHWEDSSEFYHPDRPTYDISADVNYFPNKAMLGGQNEFKFGFTWHQAKVHTFYGFGNGNYITDTAQTTPGGPLISGTFYGYSMPDLKVTWTQKAFYATDTYRRDRLTMNLGLRFDNYSSENVASSITYGPGTEAFINPFNFPGNKLAPTFNNFSPRIGATYDLTGDGKTLIRGNFARYYDAYSTYYATFINPIAFNGFLAHYTNLNGDRVITPNEIDPSSVAYFGGLSGPNFDYASFLAAEKIDPNLKNSHSNEIVAGFEREVVKDTSVSLTYTHREYLDPIFIGLPDGISSASYIQAGTAHIPASNGIGPFDVPIYTLGVEQNGIKDLTNIHDIKQVYNGFDIGVRKRMSNNFMLAGSATIQRQIAHYNGGDSAGYNIGDSGLSGVTFPFDPNIVRFNDGQPYVSTSTGSGKTGVYPYAEWAMKVSGVYQFPYDISAGAFVRYQQGYPFVEFISYTDSSLASTLGTTTHNLQVTPFAANRFDNIFTLDLQFQKSFSFKQYGRLALTADIFNITNTNTIITRNRVMGRYSLSSGVFTPSSTFHQIQENIAPRVLRIGIKYSY